MTLKLLVMAVVFLAPPASWGKRVEMPRGTANDPLEVQAVIDTFVEGIRLQDPDRLTAVVHPHARMKTTAAGQTLVRPFANWVESLGVAAEMDGAETLPLSARVTGFELKGRKARVRVLMESEHAIYADELSLEKVEGEWQIVERHLRWSARV